ncbi:MAG: polyphosphate kinase 1 [Eubacteriales bacterium]|nr:polyphosphate kinase 1 [Eubacteriales bacterium]MDD4541588.1 polyphosphate kinase 1 [Eubacteriales bacterium]
MTEFTSKFMQNRELSWLQFNLRVLEEAEDTSVEELERLRFVSIFTSNLDEFFMVRVGSLYDLSQLKKEYRENKTGLSAQEQLDLIYEVMPELYRRRDEIYAQVIADLRQHQIHNQYYDELSGASLDFANNYYKKQIAPVITPQIIDSSRPFPMLENKKLYIFVRLNDPSSANNNHYGLVPISDNFEKYISLSGDEYNYIRIEKIIREYTDEIFSDYVVLEKALIAVTRNFDIGTSIDLREEIDDYRAYMEKSIRKRKRQAAVRLEYSGSLSEESIAYLCDKVSLPTKAVFQTTAPINMSYIYGLENILPTAVNHKVSYPPFRGRELPEESIFELAEKEDILLSYPYDSMNNFLRLLREAIRKPGIQSIKVTVYRLADDSEMVRILGEAAEKGIDVTVMIEIKARFDEERNMHYADMLMQRGAQVIYGFDNYKCHAKVCLITYKNNDDEIRYITQIGTGNYNEETARQYTDFCLITANQEIGMDAHDFFTHMLTGSLHNKYLHLLQAPSTMKLRFIRLIDREIAKGSNGFLFFKMNSITDKEIIEKLQEASASGVTVQLIIRGICCLLPQVEALTENVEVRSIVGRYLEHPRVYVFGRENPDIYISSADMMTRNTEQRIEIAAPVLAEGPRNRLLEYLAVQWRDDTKARRLGADGKYHRLEKKENLIAQEYFMAEAEHLSVLDSKPNLLQRIKLFLQQAFS